MSNKYLVEALLRPPVEFYTTAICTMAAGLCAYAPWAVALKPHVGYGMALGFGLIGAKRAHEGWQILRYHRNLKRLPYYALTSKQIPVFKRDLFLGKGFRWQQKHTQRLHDCFQQSAEKYTLPSRSFTWVREFEKKHSDSFIAKLTSKDSPFNPFRPLPPVEGIPAIHGIELNEVNVTVPLSSRVGHMLVLGTTRVGKTRLAETLITQDINRGSRFEEREVVIFIDPKGDADILKRMYAEAKRAGREKEFYVFHLGWPDISARYNAVGRFNKITEVASRISGQLSGAGNSAAFKEFAWRFVNIISRALVELGRRPNYEQIARYVRSIESLFLDYARFYFDRKDKKIWLTILEAAVKVDPNKSSLAMRGRSPEVIAVDQYIRDEQIFDPVLDGLCSAVRYDKTYFDKIVASLLPLLEKLTSGKVAELLSPDYSDITDTRPIFDWEEVIRKRGIVYIGLDALSDLTVASAVGNSMFADLVSMAGHIYKFGVNEGLPQQANAKQGKIAINVHCDEFNELIGDEFIPLINKGGGAGIQVTAYTQTISDIQARTQDRAKAGQIIGNFNTLVMLRVKEQATAEVMTKNLHEVNILEVMALSGTSDNTNPNSYEDFGSNTSDRVTVKSKPMLSAADITNLPKGQAFALIEGSQLWKIRMPLPVEDKDDMMPSSLQQLADYMRNNYRTTDSWWEGVHHYQPNKEAVEAFEALSQKTLRESYDNEKYKD
ncbi:type IV conjugative transfer system coupling protein TraD [Rodentibacter caecimuris]|uniref:Conjugative coupling factor TraD, PFGI-1 class n=1 Tax=Rodentibacter caecimuris TaxID=1796644 RepID=A0AAJ3MZ40_9PAST|nr:type IV conjugative transfer system coupling protein TraD [Rodentibacter heylii]OOF72439.1 conjugative coupling factor TraD, PFGI-1 class [Rodentibacter heylii]OOF76867.1 conjugative coupling factor TraD, PFGI-1 class [Rodentibacter heylii]